MNFRKCEFFKNWQFILFPKVAPENWQEFFKFLPHVIYEVSPLHKADRPHYHILIQFPCACDFEFVSKLLFPLRFCDCVSVPFGVRSVDNWERYAFSPESFLEVSEEISMPDEVDYE